MEILRDFLFFFRFLCYNKFGRVLPFPKSRFERSNMHYLDNAATTQASADAVLRAVTVMRENYGNPSSLHALGKAAAQELIAARRAVADAICAHASLTV